MLMLLAPLKHLTEINNALQRGLASAESVFAMIDAPVEEDRGTVQIGRARGEVRYEKVSFTYPTRIDPALVDIDLHIRPGETVALVGGSGGGKTTLVRGILRALGHPGPVRSPTYALVEVYDVSKLHLHHFDFYRFHDPREWIDAGFRESFNGRNVSLIEWPEKAGPSLVSRETPEDSGPA